MTGPLDVGAGSSLVEAVPFVEAVLVFKLVSLLPGQRSLFLSSSFACSNENFFSMIASRHSIQKVNKEIEKYARSSN